ncbi:MAG: energy-coupling factor transporter transmembrane component T [Anaerolineae bacterium]|nr:energy-coupling factor transporter transmembrane component T [Anaerolineae bacterium]
MNLLLPGMYFAANTALHRLDPRVKMGAALVLMALPFAARHPIGHLLAVGLVGTVVVLSRAPLRALLGTLRTVFWLGLFMFIFYFFTTPGRPLLALGSMQITLEGILAGALQVYRLCLLAIIAALLTYTTSPLQLTHGLEAILAPLTRLGFPVRELGLVLTIALRFVPTFFEEMDTLVRAQKARGVDISSGPPWQRVRNTVAILVPLFLSAIRRAEDLAVAMDARGFRSHPYRTRLHRLALTRADGVAALVVLVCGIAGILVR